MIKQKGLLESNNKLLDEEGNVAKPPVIILLNIPSEVTCILFKNYLRLLLGSEVRN